MSTVPPKATAQDVDWALVQRTLQGDQKAYELLVLKYQKRLERVVARMVRDSDLVPDITQEAFISAYQALHQFRGEAQFYTWLYRIAMNTARKALLEKKRQPSASDWGVTAADSAKDDETFLRQLEPTHHDTPEALYSAKEVAATVNEAMEALPEDLRQALTLREIDGMSYDDIATFMQTPIGTVRSRIFRAREAVAKKLQPLLERSQGKRW